jgi:hypothetical protein
VDGDRFAKKKKEKEQKKRRDRTVDRCHVHGVEEDEVIDSPTRRIFVIDISSQSNVTGGDVGKQR